MTQVQASQLLSIAVLAVAVAITIAIAFAAVGYVVFRVRRGGVVEVPEGTEI